MASLVAQMVKKICQQCRKPRFNPWIGRIPLERREWLLIPVFLPREFQGQRNLVGYIPWGYRVKHDWATNMNMKWRHCRGLTKWNVQKLGYPRLWKCVLFYSNCSRKSWEEREEIGLDIKLCLVSLENDIGRLWETWAIRILTLSFLLEVYSAHHFHSWNCFWGCSLKRLMCY